MAIGRDGTPYVAFIDNFNLSNDATVMKFNGSTWVLVGTRGFMNGPALGLKIVLSPAGTPYVSFRGRFGAAVMKFDGSNWVSVGGERISAGAINHISLAFDSNEVPYIAFQDNTLGYRASVMKFNGTSWEVVGKEAFSPGQAFEPNIVIGPQNTPYIAFRDGRTSVDNWTAVMRFNGTEWVNVGPGSFGAFTYNPQLVITNAGVPYVAFSDGDRDGRATVMKFNGTGWEYVGPRAFTAGAAQYLSLALDFTGKLVIGFVDKSLQSKTSVMRFNGTRWETVGTPAFSTGEAIFTYLALNPLTGEPYIAFRDESEVGRITVMRYGLPSTVTSLREEDAANNIILSPNPATHNLRIQATESIESASLVNSLGVTVLSRKGGQKELHVSLEGLAPGVYSVLVSTKGKTYTRRVIVR
ncbi:T9SS type A sorting domain-containing protein [Rufibacter roseus]|uniref:T9SS type A sorting domain-containing protein n=1 Tax=Rufibacter roseus TaxID=1567108 RepID=A0ABW2DPM2_9BACT|nr:T9SS type A sorting domain-containing protein [Rufibacter roseus]